MDLCCVFKVKHIQPSQNNPDWEVFYDQKRSKGLQKALLFLVFVRYILFINVGFYFDGFTTIVMYFKYNRLKV